MGQITANCTASKWWSWNHTPFKKVSISTADIQDVSGFLFFKGLKYASSFNKMPYTHIYLLLKIEIAHQKICYNSDFCKSELMHPALIMLQPNHPVFPFLHCFHTSYLLLILDVVFRLTDFRFLKHSDNIQDLLVLLWAKQKRK